MAKGKRVKKKAKNSKKIDITVVILLVISALLVILIYAKAGSIGKELSPLLRWAYGFNEIFFTYCDSSYGSAASNEQ